MTEILKKQLFNSPVLLLVVFILPLLGFLISALFWDEGILIPLCVCLCLIISSTFYYSRVLFRRRSHERLQEQNLAEMSNLIDADIEQEILSIDSFQKRIINYSSLKDLTEDLSMSLYLEDASKTLSEKVDELFGGRNATVILYLLHSKTGELGILVSRKGQMRVNIREKKGDVFDEWVGKHMQPLLIEDIRSDFRFDENKTSQKERKFRSLISVPLRMGNKMLGILRVDSPEENFFVTDDLRFLTAIGDLGAVAIENAQLFEKLERLAIKDGLTDLFLKRHFLERLAAEIPRHLRVKESFSFLMIDLDHFKHYNDKFGHIAGDIVLRTVSMILKDTFKEPGDMICRYGGEEFAVILPGKTKNEAIEVANHFRKKVCDQSILLRRQKSNISVSVGVATFIEDATLADELIQKADKALYEAKEKGRNQVCSA